MNQTLGEVYKYHIESLSNVLFCFITEYIEWSCFFSLYLLLWWLLMEIHWIDSKWILNTHEIDEGIFGSSCECKAVSNTLHIPFHSSGISSCKLCLCNDPAMVNCEQACKSLVQSYAQTGCGKIPKGSKVKYSWKASSCSGGISNVEYVCA